jgi:hypothetical protein
VTLPQFAATFAVLAVRLRYTDADEAVIRAYFDGLQDLELELLTAAADRLARAAQWFPKTSEWRAAVEAIRYERLDAQRAYLRKSPQRLCGVCDDTGWMPVDSVERGQSVRRVTPCTCRAQRRQEILGHEPPPGLVPLTSPNRKSGGANSK